MNKTVSLLKFILPFYFVFFAHPSFAENKIDSLIALVKSDKPDTAKVQHLNELAWEISNHNPDSALILSNQALQLATNILKESEWEWGNSAIQQTTQSEIGLLFHRIGTFYYNKGDYLLSLKFYEKALAVCEQLENSVATHSNKLSEEELAKRRNKFKNKKAATINNIGILYHIQGNYPNALENYFSALKIDEETGDKNEIVRQLINIGNIYAEQKEFNKSLDYYNRGLKIAEEIESKKGIGMILGNIGNIHNFQDNYNYTKSLEYYFKALEIAEEISDYNDISTHLGNIGIVYYKQGEYEQGLDYFLKALKIAQKINDKNSIAIVMGNIGELYISTKKYSQAEKYLLQSLTISDEIHYLDNIREVNENLSKLYTQTGNFQKALEHYKNAITAKDSLFNMEKSKEITRMEMNFEFEKRETEAKAEQEKKDLKKNMLTAFSLIGLMLMTGFLIFSFRSLRVSLKQALFMLLKFFASFLSRPKLFGKKNLEVD